MDDVESQYGGGYSHTHAYENQQPPSPVHKKPNVFHQLDNKFIYIILFVVFLLGLFVGKSFMQPVLIKTMGTV